MNHTTLHTHAIRTAYLPNRIIKYLQKQIRRIKLNSISDKFLIAESICTLLHNYYYYRVSGLAIAHAIALAPPTPPQKKRKKKKN